MSGKLRLIISMLVLSLGASVATAEVTPHALFSENAVLQQQLNVPVWGTASNGEQVTVEIQQQRVSTTTANGAWKVVLKPLTVGGPFTLKISGANNTVTLTNIAVGEVWACSGQSNMASGLGDVEGGPAEMAKANDPLLRVMVVPIARSEKVERDFVAEAIWRPIVDPYSANLCGAIPYYLARDLRKARNVPVGIIQCVWGGSIAEAWIPRSYLEADPTFKPIFERYPRMLQQYETALAEYQKKEPELKKQHEEAAAKAQAEGKKPPTPPAAPVDPAKNAKVQRDRPYGIYNAMLAPLQPFAIRGAAWYQGESSAGRNVEYRPLLTTMIRAWRETWGQGDFPFLIVQLPAYGNIVTEPIQSELAELREGQLIASQKVPNAATVITIDCGDEKNLMNLHPPRKEPVGSLALLQTCLMADPAIDATNTVDLLANSLFNPVITVPLIESPPTIDGTVKDEEWANASLIPDLIADAGENAKGGGLPLEHRVRYWIQYDKEALYMAARYDVPEWSAPPQVYGTKRDVGGREDAMDIFFDPAGKWARSEEWHFGGNSAGNIYDRNLIDLSVLWRYNPVWDYKARVFPGGWEAELRIPFKEFGGRTTPMPGEKWRSNFYSVRCVPMFAVSSWAYVPTWRTPNLHVHEGWLIFSGEALAARFDQGANVVGSKGIQFSLVGKKPAEPIQTEFQLYKRDGMPTPDDPGQMVTLSTMADNVKVGGSDTYGLTHEAAVALGKAPLKKVEAPIKRSTSANGLETVNIRLTELGEYLLDYKVTKGEGDKQSILAAGSLPFRVKPPVDLQVKPRILLQDKVEFETSLTGLEDPSKAKKLHLKATSTTGGTIAFEKTVPVEGVRVVIDAPVKDLPPGKYIAHVDVFAADGAKIGESKKDFPIEKIPDWRLHPVGMEPEVPKPWTPVRVEQSAVGSRQSAIVSVWGRRYEFKGLPVPSAIEATPDPLSDAAPEEKPIQLLAGPIQLNAKAGGKAITWKCEKFEVSSKKPSAVVLESVNSGDGYVLKGKTTVEFDGMVRVEFEVTRAGGTPSPASAASSAQTSVGEDADPSMINELDLVIPFRQEAAAFLSNYRKAPGPGKIPDRYIGRVPKERWTFPVFHTQWIGTDKVGLEWFCDSMKGWRLTPKKADEGTEVVRDGDRVLEIFHLVDHEAKAGAPPLSITFGLIATPTKPAARGWEIYRTDELVSFPPTIGKVFDGSGNRTATQEDVDAWKRRAEYGGAKLNTAFWPAWSGVAYFSYPVDHDPKVYEDIKWKFKIAKEVGMKPGPYTSWAMSTKIPEWDLWGAELIKTPYEGSLFQTVYGCYNSPYTDFFVANFVKNEKLVGLTGMRHDTIAPQPACDSDIHGCGWVDENGKKWPSLNLFATREFFKRAYRETHGGTVKDGFVSYPVAGPPINAFDAFVDIHHIGEGNFERAHSLKEGYDPDQVRIRMVGRQYGFVTQNNLKGHPIHTSERVAALMVAGADPRLMGSGMPSSYFRGYQNGNWGNPNTREVWEAWRWIDRGRSSIWKAYWENADTLSVSGPNLATGTKPVLFSSYYYQPGKKILLIVTNYEQEPLENVEARLDLKKLGFSANDKLFAEDAVTSEPVEIKDGALKLSVLSERYRLLKISKDVPRYNNDRLDANLLANGGFEAWPEGFEVTNPVKGQTEPYASKDAKVFRSGASSLRLTKTLTELGPVGQIFTAPCAVAKGRYLLSGWIRLDTNLKPPLEGGKTPRPDYGTVTLAIVGNNIVTDPPREFSMWGGSFPIAEKTPGWMRFMIPFDANEDTKTVRMEITQFGVGTAWLDDVQIQKVAEENVQASR